MTAEETGKVRGNVFVQRPAPAPSPSFAQPEETVYAHAPDRSPWRARRTLSVTDFRKNPSRRMADAMGDTLAVLSRNKVEFYAVPPAHCSRR